MSIITDKSVKDGIIPKECRLRTTSVVGYKDVHDEVTCDATLWEKNYLRTNAVFKEPELYSPFSLPLSVLKDRVLITNADTKNWL